MADYQGDDTDLPNVSSQDDDTQDDAEEEVAPEEDLEAILSTKRWLLMQQLQVSATQHVVENSEPSTVDDINQLLSRIENLNEQLINASALAAVKEVLLEHLQYGQVLTDVLFPRQQEAGDAAAEPTAQDKEITEMLTQQTDLSIQILAHHRKVEELQVECSALQAERRVSLEKNRQLTEEIKLKQKKAAKRQVNLKQIQQEADDLASKIRLQRNLLHGLILGSGINWAKDAKMKKLVLSLGMPLDKVLEDRS